MRTDGGYKDELSSSKKISIGFSIGIIATIIIVSLYAAFGTSTRFMGELVPAVLALCFILPVVGAISLIFPIGYIFKMRRRDNETGIKLPYVFENFIEDGNVKTRFVSRRSGILIAISNFVLGTIGYRIDAISHLLKAMGN